MARCVGPTIAQLIDPTHLTEALQKRRDESRQDRFPPLYSLGWAIETQDVVQVLNSTLK